MPVQSFFIIRKDDYMPNDRRRILELALESLELKKKEIEEEITEINRELRGRTTARKTAPKAGKPAAARKAVKKRTRFTKEERLRRSQKMKEYWDNWRKTKAKAK
jgi:hypothetical protein